MKEKILKLAKRLKTFSLSELELIADADCKDIIQELVFEGYFKQIGNMYEYVEELPDTYKIEYFKEVKLVELTICEAIKIFLKRYAEPNCKPWTFKTYVSIFKTNIIPYFKDCLLNDLDLDAVLDYYTWLKKKKLSPQRTKNTMALLNQLLHYFQDLGVIDRRCEFKVKRVNNKKHLNVN